MKAVRYHRYGPPEVITREEVERPTPRAEEVRLAIRASSVNPFDCHMVAGRPFIARMMFGLRRPRDPRLGVDVAGVVESVGAKVTRFKAGDEVFGACRGAYAEYACAPESALVAKPRNVSFEQAAATPVAALTALQGLRDAGQVLPGHHVLINGAAGGVGTFAVQIAKALGAEVTGVCSTRNVKLVRSIGADHVIDYVHEDLTRHHVRFDVILDCVGNHPVSAFRRLLTRRGSYVAIGASTGGGMALVLRIVGILAWSPFVSQRLVLGMARQKPADLARIARFLEEREVTSVIDRQYPLGDTAEAVRYVDVGHARGKVVITI